MAAWFVALPAVVHVGLLAPLHAGVPRLAGEAVMGGLSLWIAARIVGRRTPRADHRTYLLLPVLYCCQLVVAGALG
jgi:hypothetical protein